MTTESYTPGHSATSVAFMLRRSLTSHGQFFREFLQPGRTVLDCACGPGSITLNIADAVSPAQVTGVDFQVSQIEEATGNAAARGTRNVRFLTASCYELPFAAESFDCVFSHALLEHLAQPGRAIAEFYRVLKPGGTLGVCSPDVGGLLVAPESPALKEAIFAYCAMQKNNGGDLEVGRHLGTLLLQAGFGAVQMSARFECLIPSAISEYLGKQLEQAGQLAHARAFYEWSAKNSSSSSAGLYALPWVCAVGRKG
ncbi:MAG TPA: methyltransferase domain-containing protein [Polyangiaceae bacterium]|nr:methyltransferase domain-containing protein [Polyangiaceae bacterium]